MTIGLLAAGFAALAYGLASVLQAVGVARGGARGWWASRWYLAGLGLDGAAWLVSLLALRRLPLVVVQGMLACSLAVTAVAAHLLLRTPLRRTQVAAVVCALGALTVLAAAGGAQSARPAPAGFTAATWAVTAVLVLATAVLSRRGSAAALAVVSGLGFSVAAAAARAAPAGLGPVAVVREPLVWALVVAGVVGATAYALALERGAVAIATALLWVVEAVVPAAVGVSVLGDRVRPGWAPAALAAVAVAVVACVALARVAPPHVSADASANG
ncbi:hypothetical protein [Angustibacter sp. Root456]|uniref:hypothetical protein n=1 Tax=Angustibacter sp. Root456 TaxID=1736539 RepID=UPI000701A0DD|nr:hypothetical protein [Angustibacter sp. Root456]KQX68860.1 hypothetical protein ASD06_17395 [Angustibacter sp. Root456]